MDTEPPESIPEFLLEELNKKGGVMGIIKSIPEEDKLEDIAIIHRALADVLRLKILCFLRMQDSCVCLIRRVLDIPYSKLSYHLSILKKAGLIAGEKYGNYIIYSLTPAGKKYTEDLCP